MITNTAKAMNVIMVIADHMDVTKKREPYTENHQINSHPIDIRVAVLISKVRSKSLYSNLEGHFLP